MSIRHKKLIFISTFLIILLVGGSKKPVLETKIKDITVTRENENDEHYSVDDYEKVDSTINEDSNIPIYYENENGALIETDSNNEMILYKRKFVINFEIKDYCYPEIRQLYKKYDVEEKIIVFQDTALLRSSEMLVTKSKKCWLKVEDQLSNLGWICLGTLDPYEDDNWAIIGSVDVDGKKKILRKYTGWFSVGRNQPAYDRPSLNGNVVWNSERTDDNSQINFESICVTSDTYQGNYFQEHWVKVKDSHGRIGWLPGDVLDVERGGPKYLSPENRVTNYIYEP